MVRHEAAEALGSIADERCKALLLVCPFTCEERDALHAAMHRAQSIQELLYAAYLYTGGDICYAGVLQRCRAYCGPELRCCTGHARS